VRKVWSIHPKVVVVVVVGSVVVVSGDGEVGRLGKFSRKSKIFGRKRHPRKIFTKLGAKIVDFLSTILCFILPGKHSGEAFIRTMHSVTMKRARPRRLPPASAIFLFFAAYLFYGDVSATNHDGYAYVGYGGCRDSNGNVYSNIRLPDATAAHDDSVCGQSCDIFRASGKLRGFEWLLVGSSKRCYCLLDAGTDVDTMAQEVEGGGATGKGDNDGVGEIVSAENVGIDSYCHKVVSGT